MSRVFFSYASDDRDEIGEFVSEFERRAISVLIDYEQIGPGRSIPGKINEMIRTADGALLFYSAAYARKAWTSEEQDALQFRLVEQPQFQLAVVRLDNAELPPLLAHRLWIKDTGVATLAAMFSSDIRKILLKDSARTELNEWLQIFSDDDLERMAVHIQTELRKRPSASTVSLSIKKAGIVLVHLVQPLVQRHVDTLSFLLRVLEKVSFIRSRLREQIANAGLGVFEGAFVLAERDRMRQVEEFRQELRGTLEAIVERVRLN